ncbi:biofilm regulation protein phosphatase SiaA [Noviherbaspirillum aridicola]|uniref:HAMP domain-containing protein n=1 Tax=Noviherbaspirillum aridicola TaxID=2849687 RepID=A0ABQ4Q4Z2_9BURK|nr:biofilm regulation protein phosphatase SiaA [Noviherbaspirillum aridicola]GIZ52253.1 hypothetical protein NCCP691_22670 [Noviherbaspirillum aridicola]
MGRAMGLRGKSVLALIGTCVLVLLLASAIGWQVLQSTRDQLGEAYARNLTLLNRERVLAPVARELALSQRLAGSQAVRQWLLDEQNTEKKVMAMREAEDYRQDFTDKSWFIISSQSLAYYFNDSESVYSPEPRYFLKPEDEDDGWFFNTMKSDKRFNINVHPDEKLGLTKVWFNVLIHDGERRIGLAGTGLDLTTFLKSYVHDAEAGVTPIIVNAEGAIQAHPDVRRIAYNSGTTATGSETSVFALFTGDAERAAMRGAMQAAAAAPAGAQLFSARLDGKRQLLAVAFIPELKWHVLTAVDLDAARLVDGGVIRQLLLALLALLAAIVAACVFALNRLVLAPLVRLKQSAQAMAAGDYQVALPPARGDEIGELTEAFGRMADKVRRHTAELENTVRERTRELMQANRDMSAAHKKISDSISYASLIQRAILPDRLLADKLGDSHFVLWRPRDVVGGDFYVCREADGGCLLGVIDCAGHGVPGAFMTMLARAAIDQAMDDCGAADPAAILARTDQVMRSMLGNEQGGTGVAAMMDAGLAWIDFRAGCVTFSGARIALYWSDGEEVGVIAGARRSLNDRKTGDYRNERVALQPQRTFCLTTDGFLDQAGGDKGFGFGNLRFSAMLREHARRPLSEQADAFSAALAAWQGSHPQRDDITTLCFRFA